RGVVQLTAGEYQIAGQLKIWASGIVLRGVGDSMAGTMLKATGTDRRSLIVVAGNGWREPVAGTQHSIADPYVPVGARSFRLDSTDGLEVGDTIVVRRPSTQAWINKIGMNKLANPWQPGTKDLVFDRVITRIEGDWITIDAPLTNSLDQKYGGGTVVEYVWPGRIENIGIEHILGVSTYKSSTDENHAWTFVEILTTQNAWVKDITTQNFAYAAVSIRANAKWVTVEDALCLDPKSVLTGGRRYSFYIEGQQNLVKNAFSRGARHDFVLGALAAGPNVFVDCSAQYSSTDSGPHHRWSVGTLFDNVKVPSNEINIRNRGNSGTGHGWAGANTVIWNSRARKFIVQSPPTAQNWLIGSIGSTSGTTFRDSHGKPVTPRSLYYAQLAERQAQPGLEAREYWLGDIDALNNTSGPAAAATVWSDSAWLEEVNAASGGQVKGMDSAATNKWVPLSFNFSLAPGEQVVSATLSMGVKGTSSSNSGNRVYFDSLSTSKTLAELKWGTISTTGISPKTVDLTPYLASLQDGQFNMALNNDLAVDWAVINIQVLPAPAPPLEPVIDTQPAAPALIAATADAMVRGGADADSNYGSDTWLGAMAENAAYAARASYVSFDLASLAGSVSQAIVRLPMLSAADGVANSAALVGGDWSESTITWNNKPDLGELLGSWTGAADGLASIDVTSQVNSLLGQGITKLSISIFASGGDGMVTYGSREGDALKQPLLELVG
ncbi:MAG: DNRLRE domain-containing protein, partial [Planctomycetaceae bacterium]|nr:DNRLRE domain-containing protein [Planctomycetaceae bacterium]